MIGWVHQIKKHANHSKLEAMMVAPEKSMFSEPEFIGDGMAVPLPHVYANFHMPSGQLSAETMNALAETIIAAEKAMKITEAYKEKHPISIKEAVDALKKHGLGCISANQMHSYQEIPKISLELNVYGSGGTSNSLAVEFLKAWVG